MVREANNEIITHIENIGIMKIKSLFVTAIAVCAFSFVQAQNGINATQKKQKAKIAQGVKSGELTKAETKALAKQQRAIHRAEKRAKADGVVTPAERARIKTRQAKANRSIYNQKHD